MLVSLSYKKKCVSVFAVFVSFIILAYQLSFKETLQHRSEISLKQDKINNLRDKEKEIPFLRSKMNLIENAYKKNDSTAIRDKLTEFISGFAENNSCIVTEIPSSSSYVNGNLRIETNTFTIKGGFHSLLSLQYALEKEFKLLARIMSVRFYSIRENQTKRKNLYLTLITQSFTQIENKNF